MKKMKYESEKSKLKAELVDARRVAEIRKLRKQVEKVRGERLIKTVGRKIMKAAMKSGKLRKKKGLRKDDMFNDLLGPSKKGRGKKPYNPYWGV